jgi:hypothetical protein
MSGSEVFLDPYLDPETGILRNLIGARARGSLDDAGGSLSFARLVQLLDRPRKPTGDLTDRHPQERRGCWASKRTGTLFPPVVGRFADGRGEFYGDDTYNGKDIRARFVSGSWISRGHRGDER